MSNTSRSQKIALLLTGLGPDISNVALSSLDGDVAADVRASLQKFEKQPPEQDELDSVVDQFETFLRFALDTMNAPSNWDQLLFSNDEDSPESVAPSADGDQPKIKLFEPSDDPVENLRRLDPLQIAGALATEHSKTIGLVLSRLDNDVAANTLDQLPEEAQAAAFFAMSDQSDFPDELVSRVVGTTVEKAILIEPAKIENRDADQKTADLLRQLPRPTRNRLAADLEKTDPERAARIGKLLYVFDDISLYDNRSIQKLLAQFDTKVLVTGLQDAEEPVVNAIMQNLSKRAASSLREEMEFKGQSTDEEVISARNAMADVIGKLDRAGELNLN